MTAGRIPAAAANLADWHDSSLRALGRRTRRTEALWSCEEGPGVVYLMAISLGPAGNRERQLSEMERFAARRADERIVVADTWDSLGLAARGFVPSPYGAVNDWYWRAPDSSFSDPVSQPPGLEIQRVLDADSLAEFERVSSRGFGSEELLESVGAFGIHAPAILEDARMHVYMGRVDGEPVSAAMAYVSDDVTGVFGVATPPEHRRRGYGRAMTRAAARSDPDLPCWLQPSQMGVAIYTRMGFKPLGRYTAWLREETG